MFPKPAAAPDGAFFYIYRRLAGPNGQVAFETLDHARVEGTGANAKVVSASPPFAGYISSIGGYGVNGLALGGASGVLSNYAILMWSVDALRPALPSPGLVTGKVVRPVTAAGQAQPTYAPVAGALVSGVDATGQPVFALQSGATVAVTQADGTFALWDRQFSGGTVTVSATVDGVMRTAVAYEAPPDLVRTPAMLAYRALATVTIAFPPLVPPPPAPAITVTVFREQNGARIDTQGLVTVGTPLIIGFRVPSDPTNPTTILAPTTNGQTYAIQTDPVVSQNSARVFEA